MNKDITITISGPFCSGKSTLAVAIADLLNNAGVATEIKDDEETDAYARAVIRSEMQARLGGFAADERVVTIKTAHTPLTRSILR
ncbi:adenylyl-sulfate kinase [Castellaniella sp.]|uniref:adenylyl-sulfate kinase n=1 Tax=Castellaniella sp. TaxID=1955812 RepID=UPI002AFE25D5|nr:adenylyl-sulfate kinase [Castellaniella sp.]